MVLKFIVRNRAGGTLRKVATNFRAAREGKRMVMTVIPPGPLLRSLRRESV
jgi:predicted RNA-binding protein with EMAP domain